MATATLGRFFGYVEGIDLAARLGAANDVYWLLSFVKGDRTVSDLMLSSSADGNIGKDICERIKLLLDSANDVSVIHRYDRAIAVYLLVLYLSNIDALREALVCIYDAHTRIPNLWWTYRVYNAMLPFLPQETTRTHAGNRVVLGDRETRFTAGQPGRVTGTSQEHRSLQLS